MWLPLVLELVRLIDVGEVGDLDERPELSALLMAAEPRTGGAAPQRSAATWRQYLVFLRGMRLVEESNGVVQLSQDGQSLAQDPTPSRLASIMANRVRLFTEVLAIVAEAPKTIEDTDHRVQELYCPSWKNIGNTRARMDWLEVLGLIEGIGDRKWQVTEAGRSLLESHVLVSPEAGVRTESADMSLPDTPSEIAELLQELAGSSEAQKARSTYNLWVPSPQTSPNKVENLRVVLNAATEPIRKEEFFEFVCDTFKLSRSSVESMMPFLRAAGLLREVGRGIYEATPEAEAWLESGNDINFIRLFHAHYRFVGELIRYVADDVTRSETYAEAKKYGLNVEKTRWIISFLIDTGLIEEPRYGSLRATQQGILLARELPEMNVPSPSEEGALNVSAGSELSESRNSMVIVPEPPEKLIIQELYRTARDPMAVDSVSGRGFEKAVVEAFQVMGFEAQVKSGSGDTDVVVEWRTAEGEPVRAIVEAKSRSNGHVSHTDVSDVAIETHRNRHSATFAAVVGPDFSGDTIKDMAAQKKWSLITVDQLCAVVQDSVRLGLRPCESCAIFRVPNGFSELNDLIDTRKRELDVIPFVLQKLAEEQKDTGEAISARDISRDGRKTDLSPSADEVLRAIGSLSKLGLGVICEVKVEADPKLSTYSLADVLSGSRWLRALAAAIELPFTRSDSESGH